ncbi:MAG: putative quinol monooxygenase [Parvularculaceae bacterium]
MIIVAGKAKLAPGAGAKLADALRTLIAETRKEKGCIDYSVGADAVEADTFVISEMWESVDALKAHMGTPHMAAWLKAVGAAGAVSTSIRFFEAGNEIKMG